MSYRAACLLAVAGAVAIAGCNGRATYNNGTDRYDRGLVVCLSGAGGMMGETDRIRDGLQQAGVDRAIEIFPWSRGSVFTDQTGVEANRKKARELARRLEGYMRSHPGRPVHVIGVSAGTGLVVWALEDLDPAFQATAGILISSSLNTQYDLSRALANTTDGIYSFKSVADTVLSLGVTWAGTVDRNGGLAGGLVGFGAPSGASEETKRLYQEKLHEIPWWPGDVVYGHVGDHLGATNPAYVKAKVAPIVLGKEPPEPEKKPPLEAVDAGRPAEPAHSVYTPPDDSRTRSAKQPQETPETEPPSPVKDQAEKARKDLEQQKKESSDARRRFFDWRVFRPAPKPAQTTRLPDESSFFRRPGGLP
ncbi:MAG: hypothetical protein ISS74_10390 [Planctomycetes bacterium]|nr:hypothetical protein [Planctomycetota bacterium]